MTMKKQDPLKKVSRSISDEHMSRYLEITTKALEMAKKAPTQHPSEAQIIIDMAGRYVQDASYFLKKGDVVRAFAAVNYAHGWLDCGARLGLFLVKDSKLFTVDEE
jgi:uncharacterized protein